MLAMFDTKESTGKVTWRCEPVIKHTSSLSIWGSRNIGSMDQVHEREFMDLVHILMDPVHRPWSTKRAHEPGLHVLHSPENDQSSLYYVPDNIFAIQITIILSADI